MDTLKIDLVNLKKNHWTKQEVENVALIADFVQHLMNDHDFAYVRKTFGHHNYTQHNRNIPDGMQNLISYVEKFAKQFPDYTYDVKQIYTDGDRVIFHSHATIRKAHRGDDTKGLNIVDIWRIHEGQIAEHWDSLQPLDMFMRFYVLVSGGSIQNSNGVFATL